MVDIVEYFNVESDEVNDDDSGVESKSYVKVVDPVEVILNVPLYLLSSITVSYTHLTLPTKA